MFPQETDNSLDYRRYSALTGFTPPKTPPPVEQKTSDEPEKPPADLSPIQHFKTLEIKVKNSPDEVKLLNEFIRMGYELGEYQLIENYMRQYLSRHPRDNGIRQSLAMLLIRRGNRKRAKMELRRILQYNPKFNQARELLERMRREEI